MAAASAAAAAAASGAAAAAEEAEEEAPEAAPAAVSASAAAPARALTAAFLEELLACSLCHERMRVPSSLTCGHSFCRDCLRSALRHRRECPMCRAACHTVTDPKPNVALAAILREVFRDEALCGGSKDGASAEVQEGERSGGGEPTDRVLPLFLSTSVQLPTGRSSMHLFEPRYRILAQRALDGGGDFAMVWARHGLGFPMVVEPASLVGVGACVVHVERADQTPDGRWNLVCAGSAAVRIRECWLEEGTGGLLVARLDVGGPNERPSGERAEAEAEVALAAEVEAQAAGGPEAPPGLGATRQQKEAYIRRQLPVFGISLPPARAPPTTPPGGDAAAATADGLADEGLAFAWAAALRIGAWLRLEDQQALLEAPSVDALLARLCMLIHLAVGRRLSWRSWAALLLQRWGPIFGFIFLGWVFSGAPASTPSTSDSPPPRPH